MKIAILQPGLVRRSAERLRGDRVGRLAARGRARRRRARGDPFRVRRLAHEGELSYVFERAPSEQIGRSQPELRHALACFERADDFDVINDHAGPLSIALGGLSRPRSSHGARAARRRAGRSTRGHGRSRRGRADLDLAQPAPAQAGAELGGQLPERARPPALSMQAAPRRYLLFLGRMSPDKGAHRAIWVARETGLALKLAGKKQDPKEECTSTARGTAPGRRDRVLGRGHARREGRATPERPGHPVPDRMGGAVRAGHDRVGGLRHTRDRDPARRRARGDRGRCQRDHRRPLSGDARGLERADALDPLELRRYVEERYGPERMVEDYLRVYEAAVESASASV